MIWITEMEFIATIVIAFLLGWFFAFLILRDNKPVPKPSETTPSIDVKSIEVGKVYTLENRDVTVKVLKVERDRVYYRFLTSGDYRHPDEARTTSMSVHGFLAIYNP